MDIDKLKELVKFCKKEGVLSLKQGDLELTLSPSALFPESPYKKKKKESDNSDRVELDQPSWMTDPEAAIDWSSSGAQ